ncbi:hypothetical protein B0H17DRAFT_1194518 [Mycena rosella]|uniref:Uncharacterized protein n=1 Tax=Mycena rosella TaxID=1033263 RepID=A0AAD7E0V4_MYCRO|nr:hypothetical protein B0H17DRAFT_1194518 [Mycena rosella]
MPLYATFQGCPFSSSLLDEMSVVNPSDFIPQLIIWSTFNIFAVCGLVVLLVVTLVAQGSKANLTLLNLEIIFILSSSTNSALIWTGHARDLNPPFQLCLMNAAVTISNIPLVSGAALSIVAQVWGTAMGIWHPRMKSVMEWVVWTPILVVLPFLFAVPLFIAGIMLGVRDHTKVFRGSPFYCSLPDFLLTISTVFGTVFALLTFILATWTVVDRLVARRRVGSRRVIEDSIISYAFTGRVILFSVFVLAAFVAGVVALFASDVVIPDIILSSMGVGAFFIFASAAPIVRFVFCCQRNPAWRSTLQPSTRTGSRSWSSGRGTHSELGTHIEPPQEFNLSKIQGQRDQKPAIYITRDVQIQEDKIQIL